MAKKKSVKSKRQRTPSKRKAGGGVRATARSAGGKRKTAGAKTPQGKARRKSAKNPPRPGKARKAPGGRKQTASRTGGAGKTARTAAKKTPPNRTAKKAARGPQKRAAAPGGRRGGTGRERELAQTPETGRTVRGRTNPMPTVRSTGTPAGAGDTRRAPGLDRDRKQLRELEEEVETPPSTLDRDRNSSAARSGRRHLQHAMDEHTETGPVMTGGDVDADWQDAYAVGDEAPGGDNPTPDQDVVEEIGRSIGVEYQDNEELKGADKITERDKHRWELDPASSDDYLDRE